MKKTLVISAALLVFGTSASFAGLDLAWNNCAGQAGAVTDLSIASCPAQLDLFGSIQIPVDIAQYVASDVVVDIQSTADPLPAFWRFGAGECNDGILTVSTGRFATCPASSFLLCGFTGTGCQQGFAFSTGFGGTKRARWVGSIFRPATSPVATTMNTDYFLFKMTIFNTGACAGCLDPVAIVLNSVKASGLAGAGTSAEAQEVDITGPGNVGQCASTNGATGLCGATPTKAKTWGQVKSLYR